jgi:hypothetical protein
MVPCTPRKEESVDVSSVGREERERGHTHQSILIASTDHKTDRRRQDMVIAYSTISAEYLSIVV